MIKPESLWTLCKSCPDSKWVGDIVRALGGQEVTLDFGQTQMLSAIRNDSQWMDERIEKKRESERQRKVAYRKMKEENGQSGVPQCPGDKAVSHDVPGTKRCPTPSIQPSSQPSIQPSIQPSVCETINTRAPARTRGGVPSSGDVLAACPLMGVPDWYARWWYAEMTARDWKKVDGSPVGTHNWRPVMKSWWNRDAKDTAHLDDIRQRYEIKEVKVVKYTPDDWLLCAERCANCTKDGCAKGIVIPPARSAQPYPPEECKKFKKIGNNETEVK